MKRMILMILMVAATVQISSAQTNKPQHEKRAKHENAPQAGERKHDPKQFIAKELGLTDEQAEAFAPIYAEYRKAIRGEKREQPQEKFDPKNADDAQILANLNERLDKTLNKATVRRAYVDKFLTVLTPKQLAKLYHMEDSFGQNARGPQHGPHNGVPQPPHGGHNDAHNAHGPQHGHGGPAPR